MAPTEQSPPPARRGYHKRKRAAGEELTRARIVDAAEELHGSVGPAHTTVSAVAERAGVTRATVYRHFPDDEALFLSCSSQWLARQRLPDQDAWNAYADPLTRLGKGLADIYRYYRAGEQMLTRVHRDADHVPAAVRASRAAAEQGWVEALVAPFPRPGKTLRAAVGHAVAFDTWRSLCVTHGLTDRSAVDLMVGMVGSHLR